jgi:peptidoglycan-associated lipoprotein
MNQTQLKKLLFLAPLLIAAVTGCKTNRYGPTPLGSGTGSGSTLKGQVADLSSTTPIDPAADAKAIGSEGLAANDPTVHSNWIEHPEMFQEYVVHFEYDSSVVRADERSKLQAIAEQLKANAGCALRIQGHCDERGTEEYNRSLGERRAIALREELVLLGIDPKRLDTATFGEDRPVVAEHNDTAWKQNRRGQFVGLTAPN